LRRFDERDARTCLDVISDMAESPLHFLSPYVEVTARAMIQIMNHGDFEIYTRDSAGLVLRNLIEMKPRAIGKRGLVPEVCASRFMVGTRVV
jgi:hypothetical protein